MYYIVYMCIIHNTVYIYIQRTTNLATWLLLNMMKPKKNEQISGSRVAEPPIGFRSIESSVFKIQKEWSPIQKIHQNSSK